MPLLDKCCFCVPLRMGGLILGILSVMGAMVQLTFMAITLNASLGKNGHKLANVLNQSMQNTPEGKEMDADQVVLALQYISIVIITISSMTLICAFLLIYGAYSRRRYFIIPYLVSEAMSMLFLVGLFCSYMVQGLFASGAVLIIGLGIQMYLWFCVYSLCQQIREDSHRKESTNNPDLNNVTIGYKMTQ